MNKKKNKSDKMYSTYWWIIHLDKNHPSNYNKNVTEITGYSKILGYDECQNKHELLMKRIIMLHSNGYFEKSNSISIYYKQGEFLNKTTSIELLRLYKNDYEVNPRCLNDTTFYNTFFIKGGIVTFLTKFYDCIKTGRSVGGLLPKTKNDYSKDDVLDYKIKRFNSIAQLMAFAEQKIKSGYPVGAVMNYVIKYISLHFPE